MKNTSAALQVAYEYVEESIEPLIHNSLPIAALTTAYGRVHLFEALHRISPENLLYAGERIVCIETFLSISLSSDTDSILYVHKDGEEDPLRSLMGECLGQLTDELPSGARGVAFTSQGPKVFRNVCDRLPTFLRSTR